MGKMAKTDDKLTMEWSDISKQNHKKLHVFGKNTRGRGKCPTDMAFPVC